MAYVCAVREARRHIVQDIENESMSIMVAGWDAHFANTIPESKAIAKVHVEVSKMSSISPANERSATRITKVGTRSVSEG